MAANHARSWQYTHTEQAKQNQKQKVVIRKKSWITKGEKVLYSAVGICLIIAAALIVSFSSSSDTLNRQVQSLEQKVQKQELKVEALEHEVKELSEPERILEKAKKHGLKVQNTEMKQANTVNE